MVMLSNKRSKKQMTEDLMLFLGENTVKFIDWYASFSDFCLDCSYCFLICVPDFMKDMNISS